MTNHVRIKPGAYADSVTLLQVSKEVSQTPGVQAAQVAMATPLNLDTLAGMGFDLPETTENDMIVALRLAADGDLEEALAAVDAALAASTRRPAAEGGGREPARTTASALRTAAEAGDDAALALVSVPGEHAFVEAMDAVEA